MHRLVERAREVVRANLNDEMPFIADATNDAPQQRSKQKQASRGRPDKSKFSFYYFAVLLYTDAILFF